MKTQILSQKIKPQTPKEEAKKRMEIILKAVGYAKIRHLIKTKDILAVDLDKSFDNYYVELYLRNSPVMIVVRINEKSELMESWIQPIRGWE